jgi:hypothetical protein
MFRGHYAFGIDAVVARLEQVFPDKYMDHEVFLVRPPRCPGLCARRAALLVGIGTLLLATMAVSNLLRRQLIVDRRALALLVAWFAAYVGFFTFWDPQNADFWIVPTFLLWYLLGALLPTSNGLSRPAALVMTAVVAGLFVVTSAGIIRFTTDEKNDFYAVQVQSIPRPVSHDDLLIVGDDWPIARHIRYRVGKQAVYLTNEVGRRAPRQIVEQAAAIFESGRRVFISRGRPEGARSDDQRSRTELRRARERRGGRTGQRQGAANAPLRATASRGAMRGP